MRHLGDRDVTAPLPRVIVCMALLGGKAMTNVRPAFLSAGRPADCSVAAWRMCRMTDGL